MNAGYLSVSGPLDFCLVIQVLFGPRMILNACARRPDLGLTSHLNDAALPHEKYTHIQPALCPEPGSNPGHFGWEASTLPLSYIPSTPYMT